MKKILVKKSSNFTTINNEFIFNKDMSLKAKGLLCHLLALPESWDLYVEEVEKWHKDGKKAIYSAFKELSQFGYIERLQKRDKGLFKGYEYIVHEVPFDQKRETDKRDAEKAPLLNTDIKLNTDINKKEEFDFEELEELNIEVWKKWRAYRKETFRLTYKPIGEKAAIGKLMRLSQGCHEVQEQIIQQSIENGWKGIFDLKEQKQSKTKSALDNWQKARNMINNA
jgi:predicted transcriptional regulator